MQPPAQTQAAVGTAACSGYVDAIKAAAQRLVDDRLMLAEDIERVVALAQDWGQPLHDVRL